MGGIIALLQRFRAAAEARPGNRSSPTDLRAEVRERSAVPGARLGRDDHRLSPALAPAGRSSGGGLPPGIEASSPNDDRPVTPSPQCHRHVPMTCLHLRGWRSCTGTVQSRARGRASGQRVCDPSPARAHEMLTRAAHPRIAAAAAAASSPGMTCWYTRSVIAMSECPSRWLSTFTGAPAASAAVA